MITQVFLAGLDHLLGQSAWARERLKPYAGRHARFCIGGGQLGLTVTADGGFALDALDTVGAAADATPADTATPAAAAPDVVITLPTDTPLLLLQGGLARVMQAVRVEGNAEFATELAFVLKNLRWDYEEDLSRVVGDIAAHRISGGLHALAGWQRQAAGNFADNLLEYVTEENPLVVGHHEHKMFADEVIALLDTLQKTERRLDRLRR